MSRTETLRRICAQPGLVTVPACHDALSARLVERAGFPVGFMSGFGVSAARLGLPDAGLIGYAELVDQGRAICDAVSIPMLGSIASLNVSVASGVCLYEARRRRLAISSGR